MLQFLAKMTILQSDWVPRVENPSDIQPAKIWLLTHTCAFICLNKITFVKLYASLRELIESKNYAYTRTAAIFLIGA